MNPKGKKNSNYNRRSKMMNEKERSIGKIALSDDELENVSGGGLVNRRFRNMTPEQFLSLSPEEKGQYYEWLQKRSRNRSSDNDLPAWLQNFGK